MENDKPTISEISMCEKPSTTIETPRKAPRRHRLRRLAESQHSSPKAKIDNSFIKYLSGLLLLLVILLAHHLSNTDIATQNFIRDFRNSYRKHYHQIVHGKQDYCSHDYDTAALLKRIRTSGDILHQEHAMSQLELALRNDSRLTSIAFVGPVGVGKTMLARGVMQNFPWQNNIQIYAWNTFVQDEVEKFHVVRMFLQHLTDCGRNLLIIDNLSPCESALVPLLNKMIAEVLKENEHLAAMQRVIVIYIFTLNGMAPLDIYKQQLEKLQHMPQTKTINFKAFGNAELRDCIQLESAMQQMILSSDDVEDIVNTLNASQSGCKNVHAKVLTHGQLQRS